MKPLAVVIDLVSIVVLTFAIYLPRYRRRDLLINLLALNVGVLCVTAALTSASVTLGAGFGVFGALSIVRLRSDELAQQDVAYFFASVALAILGGVALEPTWLGPVLSALIVGTMFLGDHPAMFPKARQQVVVLDRAITDEAELAAHLEERLGATVTYLNVRKTDLVNDSTTVDVRYRLNSRTASPAGVKAVPRWRR